jgi:hypothetical protein
MKKFLNIAAAVALLFGVSTAAIAQDNVSEEYYPHNFISLQGGAQVTLTHYDIMDLVTPQFGVSFGRYFNSKVGARLHFQGRSASQASLPTPTTPSRPSLATSTCS